MKKIYVSYYSKVILKNEHEKTLSLFYLTVVSPFQQYSHVIEMKITTS